ncbi:hypothetical protein ABXV19_08715 [Pseudomonas alkylphenolica]|uniref:hypothetical protein n=1 Tax=Pseudomonas alkylphenolica TaxID=237609 RepID=UPI0033947DF7
MSLFYLQDSRPHAYVGDGLSFWGIGGSGYVTDLDKAQLFAQDGALDHRDTDIPWPKDYIDARIRIGVDHQYICLTEAFEQHPDSPDFYLQKPKDWNGNNLIWLDATGQTTSNLRVAMKVPAALVACTSARLRYSGAVAWPCAYIDAHSRRLVERDDVNLKEALRGTGINLPKPRKVPMMMFNCAGCGRFVSDRQRFEHNCSNCGQDNKP